MSKIFNWGIIGCGRIAHKFASDVCNLPQAQVYAVASRSLQNAQSFAQTFAVKHALDCYQSLLQLEGLDAVYIATPHVNHADHAMTALNANIPVLCEKPLAMNARQVRSMITASQDNHTFLMEALWTRFMPPIVKVLELIEAGEIGELQSVDADFGFEAAFDPQGRLFDPALGGGSLLDIGIYPVFLALLLFGKPDRIEASACFTCTHVDASCDMSLTFPQNKTARLHSTIIAKTDTEAVIHGSKGFIQMHSRWHEMTSISLHLKGNGQPQKFEFESNALGYCYEAEEVMHCVSQGRLQSEKMSHDFSLLLIETLDGIRQKAGIVYAEDRARKTS